MNRLLSLATDEEYLLLFYAINALQQGNEIAASRIFRRGFPQELAGNRSAAVNRANEWEIETLCNEILTTSHTYHWVYSWHPRMNCGSAHAAMHLVHALRDLENEEYAFWGHDIRYEMRRVVNRQFEWQRGFFNKALAYRISTMFGGPECQRYLREETGLALDEINFTGFILWAAFTQEPFLREREPTGHIGLDHDTRDRVVSLIAGDIDEVRMLARLERQAGKSIAYKPSILRRFPVLRRRNGVSLICPLPQLITYRTTSGVYYDLVPGGGAIRNEIGRNFERYCVLLLTKVLRDCAVRSEFSYFVRDRQESPDFLLKSSGKTWCIGECKAIKMSFDAKFGEGELLGRGYDELAKAVFQIWRYASHVRRGLVPDKLGENVVGLVVSLDDWMTMVLGASEVVLQRAKTLCSQKDAEISNQDQIPITFAEIGSLENVLMSTNSVGFRRHLLKAQNPEFRDWLLSSIPIDDDSTEERPFPFDDLGDVVRWWGQVEKMTG